MKLDKVEENPKKKNKKMIILTASTVAVLTFSGVAGWMFFKDRENNEITKFARSIMSGERTKQALGDNDLDPATIKSLQSLLSKTGFGYAANTSGYQYTNSMENMVNPTDAESLYMMCHENDTYNYKTVKGSNATRKSK